MTTLNTARPATNAAISGSGVFATIFSSFVAWYDMYRTRRALMALSVRELEDIGLTAADIDAVARRSFR